MLLLLLLIVVLLLLLLLLLLKEGVQRVLGLLQVWLLCIMLSSIVHGGHCMLDSTEPGRLVSIQQGMLCASLPCC